MVPRVEEVLAGQIASLRSERGLSQEGLAERVRRAGLPWVRGTVAQAETGRRQLSAVELVVVAAVLMVPPSVLLTGQEADEVVVGDATWRTDYLRAVVADGGGWVPNQATFTSPTRDAHDRWLAEAAETEDARQKEWTERWGLQNASAGLVSDLVRSVGKVETEAARRLRLRAGRRDIGPADVAAAAAHRWGRSLLAERDRRVAERATSGPTARTLQAVRGRVTHELDRELLHEIDKTPLEAKRGTGKGYVGRVSDPKWAVRFIKGREQQ
jgi:transcriptional regulator with XRE-family HTH domain